MTTESAMAGMYDRRAFQREESIAQLFFFKTASLFLSEGSYLLLACLLALLWTFFVGVKIDTQSVERNNTGFIQT